MWKSDSCEWHLELINNCSEFPRSLVKMLTRSFIKSFSVTWTTKNDNCCAAQKKCEKFLYEMTSSLVVFFFQSLFKNALWEEVEMIYCPWLYHSFIKPETTPPYRIVHLVFFFPDLIFIQLCFLNPFVFWHGLQPIVPCILMCLFQFTWDDWSENRVQPWYLGALLLCILFSALQNRDAAPVLHLAFISNIVRADLWSVLKSLCSKLSSTSFLTENKMFCT